MSAKLFIGKLFRPGLLGNIGANGLGQIVQIALQLLAVPVYAHSLGIERYGVWLVFITVPSYLTVSDFGLTVASGNDMTARVAREDLIGARTTYRAMRRTMVGVMLALSSILALLATAIFPHALDFAVAACNGQPLVVISVVLLYGLAMLHCNATFAAYRATGDYAFAAYRMQWITLAEALLAMAMAIAGYGLLGMALSYAVIRWAGSIWLWVLLRGRSPFYFTGKSESAKSRSLALLYPAISAFALPAANILVLQGMVGLVGAFAGAMVVPAFTATRTVARLPIQVSMIVNFASLPEFTASHARGDRERMAQLTTLTILAIICCLLPAALFVALFGTEFVDLWSGGKIHAPTLLVLAMVVSMLANGSWMPFSNLLLAINKQASFSFIYLSLVVAGVFSATKVLPIYGASGAAMIVAAIDVIMVVLIFWLARRNEILSFALLRSVPFRAMSRFSVHRSKDL